jgi:hypothetical protein
MRSSAQLSILLLVLLTARNAKSWTQDKSYNENLKNMKNVADSSQVNILEIMNASNAHVYAIV